MRKLFNVSGNCKPALHYMVDIKGRLAEIKEMIDRGDYFTMNRARQYGKTTTLKALAGYLGEEYTVLSLDFQKLSHMDFETEENFVEAVSREILKKPSFRESVSGRIADNFRGIAGRTASGVRLADLFECFSEWCEEAGKPIVFIVDEVDSATNNQVFLDFLSQLRGYYTDRDETPFFQSVILAGVYDIKNLKRKIVEGEEHKSNSPWNIAADFLVDMSFSQADIAGMLEAYERDLRTGMDVEGIAELIYDYTSGYPFLVSGICKLTDERVVVKNEREADEEGARRKNAWTKKGILQAVRILLSEQNTLFDSLIHKLEDYPELEVMLRELLFHGKEIPYVVGVRSVEIAMMFGFVKKAGNYIVIANRIFETLLYNLFLASPDMRQNPIYDEALLDRNQFIQNGRLNMNLVLEKFVTHFDELYGSRQQIFMEEDGRRYFLLYLRPIINGAGNYYIEAQTRNMERTDVIVDFHGEQFVIELKIWRGNAYHERGEKQLTDYLNYYHLDKGYMLSFNFNKKKQIGVRELKLGDKILVEAVV